LYSVEERSVATPELFFGQAIQIIPLAVSLAASLAKSRERSFGENKKENDVERFGRWFYKSRRCQEGP
jgi:hypothetical protein